MASASRRTSKIVRASRRASSPGDRRRRREECGAEIGEGLEGRGRWNDDHFGFAGEPRDRCGVGEGDRRLVRRDAAHHHRPGDEQRVRIAAVSGDEPRQPDRPGRARARCPPARSPLARRSRTPVAAPARSGPTRRRAPPARRWSAARCRGRRVRPVSPADTRGTERRASFPQWGRACFRFLRTVATLIAEFAISSGPAAARDASSPARRHTPARTAAARCTTRR